jgi:hypothetical protein
MNDCWLSRTSTPHKEINKQATVIRKTAYEYYVRQNTAQTHTDRKFSPMMIEVCISFMK